MPSSSTTPADGDTQSAVYRAIMTPINLISFLISLVLIDMRYTATRVGSHQHDKNAHGQPSRLPAWLHRLLFRKHTGSSGTRAGVGAGAGTASGRDKGASQRPRNADQDGTEAYYHSKQRKLMRLEAEDAFRIRGSVVLALALLGVGAILAGVVAGRAIWGAVSRATAGVA